MALARLLSCMKEKRNASKVLVGKPDGKRPLGRTTRGWKNNIKRELNKT
jgi:hypothetical protein